MTTRRYEGGELDLFANAGNWKRYWGSRIAPWIGDRILDVGAGLGATLDQIPARPGRSVVALEPDPELAAVLTARATSGNWPVEVDVRVGTLQDMDPQDAYDTILYIDVLEHIEDDARELADAAARLRPGGRLIVLAPAHQWLFSPFDAEIGHHRRYTRRSLAAVAPAGLERLCLDYLDCVGVCASLANRLFLRSAHPTVEQIRLWDRLMVPISMRLDPLLVRRVGKTVLGVWQRSA